MSHLSEGLAKYYTRSGNRIRFRNGQSLNGLAMAMWERLDFAQVDTSVLSRVLKGERLFTAAQLEVFCTVLYISEKEKRYLLSYLEQDRAARYDLPIGITHISSQLAEEIVRELTRDAFDLFYKGEYKVLDTRHDLVMQLADACVLAKNDSKAVTEAVGFNLYLRGRAIANGELPSRVVGRVYPVFNQLLVLSKQSQSTVLHGYAYVLLSTAYYLAGGYSDATAKYKYYSTSIKLAKEAIDTLPEDDHESLFALRSIAASATYTHDDEAISYVLHRVKEIIPKQPESNYINTLHLSATLSKSLAAAKISSPFAVQEFATDYFHKTLANTGVYEVSGIKEEIDTLLLLKTGDNTYIKDKLEEGLRLAIEYNFPRQKKYFNKLLTTV